MPYAIGEEIFVVAFLYTGKKVPVYEVPLMGCEDVEKIFFQKFIMGEGSKGFPLFFEDFRRVLWKFYVNLQLFRPTTDFAKKRRKKYKTFYERMVREFNEAYPDRKIVVNDSPLELLRAEPESIVCIEAV